MKRTAKGLVLSVTCCVVIAAGCAAPDAAAPKRPWRQFAIRYVAQVRGVPADAKVLRLWLPYPRESVHQEIAGLKVHSPYPHRLTRDKKHGNRIVYIHAKAPRPSFDVEVSYTVTRYVNDPAQAADTDRGKLKWALKPQRLVPNAEEAEQIAAGVVQDAEEPAAVARALYDHTMEHMTYDKSCAGWGRGSWMRACNVGKGNCTDFHAYFIGLARSVDVPAYFEIGLTVPVEPPEGKTGAYHCWAYFWDGARWVPVDISEADKHPKKAEFLFGRHDAGRVALSIGRDIVLEPKQSGPPLNYFLFPYAEVDGKPHGKVTKTSYYKAIANGR